MENMLKVVILGFIIILKVNTLEGKDCVLSSKSEDGEFNVTDGSAMPLASSKYICPLDGNWKCCENSTKKQCCPTARHFYEIENTLAIIISSTVVTGCVVIAIIVIVCCFYNKCLLYDACRMRYTDFDIVAFDKNTATGVAMPDEPKNKQSNHYFVQCKRINEENL